LNDLQHILTGSPDAHSYASSNFEIGAPPMLNFWKDIQYAFRALLKNPGFAIIGIVTLALGMAANTTIFSVVNGLILRPMSVPHPEQITVLALQQSGTPGLQNFSYPDFLDLRSQTDSLGELFAYRVSLAGLNVDNKGDHCIISRVSNNFFSALGITPAAGRLILPTEGVTPGADPIVVLGYSYWQKRFAGDPDVLGKHVEMNGHPATIVGVTPKGFYGTYAMLNMDAYVPLSATFTEEFGTPVTDMWTKRELRTLIVLGRLKPGVDLKHAQASLDLVAKRIGEQYPDSDKDISVRAYPEKRARPEPDDTLPTVAFIFISLSSLVLLVACFNVANVLLVRATVRQREMAIRAALGAGRSRLVRQYLTESLLLALFGGGAGLLLASWASGFLSSLSLGTSLPVQFDFRPDGRVYLFAFAAVLITGLIVGIVPALRTARTDVTSILHEGGRGSSDGPRRQFTRNSLVAAQVAGSLVLLIVAGLFIRSLGKAQNINLGFDPNQVLNLSTDVGGLGYSEARGREFYRDLETRIRALPGVVSEAQAFTVPLGYISEYVPVSIPGRPVEAGKQPPGVEDNSVTPGYFNTLRMPLLRGRDFTEADGPTAPPVAVISEAMAKKFWPAENALGKTFFIKDNPAKPIEIIGVIQDAKYRDITEDPQPIFYIPFAQSYMSMRTIHVRTSVPPESLAVQIQELISQLAPGLAVSEVQDMRHALQGANGFFFYSFGAQVTAVLGLLGLILAVVGIYSVVSYAAAQRTQEIGIRIAMGASPSDILRMVLRQGISVVGIGLVLGLVISLAGTRLLSGLVVGVKPSDPITFIIVVLLLTGIALFACWIPARRATRIDPLIALRHE
jgi:predicted permease